jgi:hypothetical protein
MARVSFAPKTSKGESIDKTPYTLYYPHSKAESERVDITHSTTGKPYWYQFISIDPGRKNFAFRIERRSTSNACDIQTLVFAKVSVEDIVTAEESTICYTYQKLSNFLDTYRIFYDQCHYVVIERQLPINYKATRIAQHTISYFSLVLHNKPALPYIVEIDPKLKGKILGAPKGISDKQLKVWSIERARQIAQVRNDQYSLNILDNFKRKQDDLADTICQVEALCRVWGEPFLATPDHNIEAQLVTPFEEKQSNIVVTAKTSTKISLVIV